MRCRELDIFKILGFFLEFFWNFFGIVLELFWIFFLFFFWNSFGIYFGIFLEFFWNSLGILSQLITKSYLNLEGIDLFVKILG